MSLWPFAFKVERHQTYPESLNISTVKSLHACISIFPCKSGLSFLAFSELGPKSALDRRPSHRPSNYYDVLLFPSDPRFV